MADMITYIASSDNNQYKAPAIEIEDAQNYETYANMVAQSANRLEALIRENNAMGCSLPSFMEPLLADESKQPKTYVALAEHAKMIAEQIEKMKRMRQELLHAGHADIINGIVDTVQQATSTNFSGYRLQVLPSTPV
jgi:hypothetical protein